MAAPQGAVTSGRDCDSQPLGGADAEATATRPYAETRPSVPQQTTWVAGHWNLDLTDTPAYSRTRVRSKMWGEGGAGVHRSAPECFLTRSDKGTSGDWS